MGLKVQEGQNGPKGARPVRRAVRARKPKRAGAPSKVRPPASPAHCRRRPGARPCILRAILASPAVVRRAEPTDVSHCFVLPFFGVVRDRVRSAPPRCFCVAASGSPPAVGGALPPPLPGGRCPPTLSPSSASSPFARSDIHTLPPGRTGDHGQRPHAAHTRRSVRAAYGWLLPRVGSPRVSSDAAPPGYEGSASRCPSLRGRGRARKRGPAAPLDVRRPPANPARGRGPDAGGSGLSGGSLPQRRPGPRARDEEAPLPAHGEDPGRRPASGGGASGAAGVRPEARRGRCGLVRDRVSARARNAAGARGGPLPT